MAVVVGRGVAVASGGRLAAGAGVLVAGIGLCGMVAVADGSVLGVIVTVAEVVMVATGSAESVGRQLIRISPARSRLMMCSGRTGRKSHLY